MDPSLPKKLKSDEDEKCYFSEFLKDVKNQGLLQDMRAVLNAMKTGFPPFNVTFCKVLSTNAASDECFTNAKIKINCIYENESRAYPVVAPVNIFFTKGLYALELFLDKNNPKIINDVLQRKAVRNLLQFLKDGMYVYSIQECIL